jgi:hypothetical protein
MADYDAPNEPFMEVWGFYLSFRQRPPMTRSAMSIRYRVLSHLEGSSREKAIDELPEDLASLNLIQSTLRDLAEDHLCCPEYDFFFANYEEKDGSLDVGFEIAVVFFGDGSGYGTFRTGLDTFYKDLKKLLKGIEGIKVRTRRRFSRRKVAGPRAPTTSKVRPAKGKKP